MGQYDERYDYYRSVLAFRRAYKCHTYKPTTFERMPLRRLLKAMHLNPDIISLILYYAVMQEMTYKHQEYRALCESLKPNLWLYGSLLFEFK
jgi:hypothetical protein